MVHGIRAAGGKADIKPSTTYQGRPTHDVAVFYGLSHGLARIFADYRAHRKAVYIDLGYWNRHGRNRYDGFHKVAVNSRHPNAYMMARSHNHDRWAKSGLAIRPWRDGGDHILVAGMSDKAAMAEGFSPHQWERETIDRLRALTNRPIVYRPKPSWRGARPLDGATFERDQTLDEAFANCHAVVTHHSNVGIEAVLAGVPVFTKGGAAAPMAAAGLASIERPLRPDGREQWAWNLAWCQWSVREMQEGLAYRYLIRDGLI